MINEDFQPEYRPESPADFLKEKLKELVKDNHELTGVEFDDLRPSVVKMLELFIDGGLTSREAAAIRQSGSGYNDSENSVNGYIINFLFNRENKKQLDNH